MPPHSPRRSAVAKRSPYQRIVLAAKKGRGVHLSADEAFQMSMDTAISDLAANDDEEQDAQPEEENR